MVLTIQTINVYAEIVLPMKAEWEMREANVTHYANHRKSGILKGAG
jgi:hypothetical protein